MKDKIKELNNLIRNIDSDSILGVVSCGSHEEQLEALSNIVALSKNSNISWITHSNDFDIWLFKDGFVDNIDNIFNLILEIYGQISCK